MTQFSRGVVEGVQKQGEDEKIIYQIDTLPWGGSPVSPLVKVYNSQDSDVTSSVIPTGDPSLDDDVIVLPPIQLLTAGNRYRVEVRYTSGGNIFEFYFYIQAER